MITKTINDECECPFMHKIYVGSAKICFIYCALNSSGVYCGYMLELVFVDWYRRGPGAPVCGLDHKPDDVGSVAAWRRRRLSRLRHSACNAPALREGDAVADSCEEVAEMALRFNHPVIVARARRVLLAQRATVAGIRAGYEAPHQPCGVAEAFVLQERLAAKRGRHD